MNKILGYTILLVGFLLSPAVCNSPDTCVNRLKGLCECGTNDMDHIIIHKCKDLTEVPDFSNIIEADEKMIAHVDLSGNRIVTIRADDFKPLMSCRYTLDLSNNLIENIEPKAFDYFTGVIKINLNGNKLTSIPSDAFSPTRNGILGTLSLSKNKIASVHSNELNELPTTTSSLKLDLSYNPLEYMTSKPESRKSHLETLSYLNISHTRLVEVPSFFVSKKLVTLDISSTGLSRLDGAEFALMGYEANTWVTVDVSNNTLEHVDEATFENTDKINVLKMSRCSLKKLPKNILSFKTLTHLDLSSNSISDFPLPKPAYPGNPGYNLTSVLLSGNNLTTLPNEICQTFKKLSVIDVYDNPMVGDLSDTLEKIKTCKSVQVQELTIYWPSASMNCSCDQLADWYRNSDNPTKLRAFNCMFSGTCGVEEEVGCSSVSDNSLKGIKINDLDSVRVSELCSLNSGCGNAPGFVGILVFMLVFMINY